MATLTKTQTTNARNAAKVIAAANEGNEEWQMPPLPKSIDTWPKLEAFAKTAGLTWENRAELIEQVRKWWPGFDVTQVKTVVGDIIRDLFNWIKQQFQGGIWVHFDIDPETGKVVIRLTLGKDGKPLTKVPLTQSESAEVIEAIKSGNVQAIRTNKKLKKSRIIALMKRTPAIEIKNA